MTNKLKNKSIKSFKSQNKFDKIKLKLKLKINIPMYFEAKISPALFKSIIN